MIVPLGDDFLLIRGSNSFLLIGKACSRFQLFIETSTEELCQTLDPDDLIVVSAPEGGSVEHAGVLLGLVRTYRQPLLVLPRGHPGSRRLSMVVSVGPEILLACGIQRGTHPEQHLICSSEELSGMHLKGVPGGVEILSAPPSVLLEHRRE